MSKSNRASTETKIRAKINCEDLAEYLYQCYRKDKDQFNAQLGLGEFVLDLETNLEEKNDD